VTLLVISPDYASHLLPLATLATAWAEAGERVVVATGPAVAPLVADFGYEHAPLVLGRGSNPGIIRAEDQPPGEDDSLRGFFAATREGMIPTLAYQAAARGDDLLWAARATSTAVSRVLDAVRPDAVIVDHLAFSATLALRAAGIDYGDVVLGHPTALPVDGEVYGEAVAWPSTFQPEAAAIAALREQCLAVRDRFTATYNDALLALAPGASPVPDAFAAHGPTVLYNYPAALHDPRRTALVPSDHVFLGSLVRSEVAPPDVASWLDADDPRPIVYVSFGSFLSARSDVLRVVVDGLRALPIRVAVATGTTDAAGLGAPADWLVRPSLAQVALLDRASVAVTHAGNNSVTEALTAGVPMVALPFSTDQFAGAAALEAAGLAVTLDPNAASPTDVGKAVMGLLASPSREAADRMSEALRADPGAARGRRAMVGATRPGAVSRDRSSAPRPLPPHAAPGA
jgi:zeaxanthin glucosyltransferase